jgi:hypothetical protein
MLTDVSEKPAISGVIVDPHYVVFEPVFRGETKYTLTL